MKITGLPTKKKKGQTQSYNQILEILEKLELVFRRKLVTNQKIFKFVIIRTQPPVTRAELKSYSEKFFSQEEISRQYLSEVMKNRVNNIRIQTQKGSRIFDAVGEAISRRHMLVVFDFNLIRTVNDYDIEGLLDRVYSVFRKKFKQIVITYCISKSFTKAAQHKAKTGRFKQINLVEIKIQDGKIVTRNIDGITSQERGEYFENQIRYVLKQSGFRDIQRGLKVYRDKKGLTDHLAPEEFSDIDIITSNKNRTKTIICELKNWDIVVPYEEIERWVQNKLNPIIDFLRNEIRIDKDLETWYIVSKKIDDINEDDIKKKCKCNIRILSKVELINDVIAKMNPIAANELRSIVLY